MTALCLAQDPAADALLSRDPFALLVGMLLDQQYPMEHAFRGPQKLADRLGVDRLDPAAIAEHDPEAFVVADYGGDAAAIWTTAPTGEELLRRLKALPGYGEQKARIFLALLGKQLGVTPKGWREAAGAYGEQGSRRSVADVTGPETLLEVRAYKQEAKQAAKTKV